MILSRFVSRERYQVLLCLNEFTGRVDRFRASRLWVSLAQNDEVYDPCLEAQRGTVIAFKSNMSRKNPDEVLQALRTEMGVLYSVIEMNRYAWRYMLGFGGDPGAEAPGEPPI